MKDRSNRRINPSVFLFLLLFVSLNPNRLFSQESLYRVMSFNIRYDNPADGINSWDNRKELLVSSLTNISPDIFGLQEVLKQQLEYLDDKMPAYRSIGVGREDGRTTGEYVPVFYKHTRFGLLDNGTFWLSPAPGDTGSVGWDAALTRICTWGKFRESATGLEFYFLNTHFDHMGDTARTESARLILDFINSETGGLPVILTGDFNSSPADKPYLILTGTKGVLTDVCQPVNLAGPCNEGTFNGFGSEKEPQRIDMVFYKGRWEAGSYNVPKIKDGEMFISDHWPVVVELKIKN
jgi:endonuclease/exonuclease/phosphatase family metal-dependent hydrolase